MEWGICWELNTPSSLPLPPGYGIFQLAMAEALHAIPRVLVATGAGAIELVVQPRGLGCHVVPLIPFWDGKPWQSTGCSSEVVGTHVGKMELLHFVGPKT